jgi:hypothetical protein
MRCFLIGQNIAHFFVKFNVDLCVEKSIQNFWATSGIFLELPIVNNRPTGENSPTLFTLPSRQCFLGQRALTRLLFHHRTAIVPVFLLVSFFPPLNERKRKLIVRLTDRKPICPSQSSRPWNFAFANFVCMGSFIP